MKDKNQLSKMIKRSITHFLEIAFALLLVIVIIPQMQDGNLTFSKTEQNIEYKITEIAPYYTVNGERKTKIEFTPTDISKRNKSFSLILGEMPSEITLNTYYLIDVSTYSCNYNSANINNLLTKYNWADKPDPITNYHFKYSKETLSDTKIKKYQTDANNKYSQFLQETNQCRYIIFSLCDIMLILLFLYHRRVLINKYGKKTISDDKQKERK